MAELNGLIEERAELQQHVLSPLAADRREPLDLLKYSKSLKAVEAAAAAQMIHSNIVAEHTVLTTFNTHAMCKVFTRQQAGFLYNRSSPCIPDLLALASAAEAGQLHRGSTQLSRPLQAGALSARAPPSMSAAAASSQAHLASNVPAFSGIRFSPAYGHGDINAEIGMEDESMQSCSPQHLAGVASADSNACAQPTLSSNLAPLGLPPFNNCADIDTGLIHYLDHLPLTSGMASLFAHGGGLGDIHMTAPNNSGCHSPLMSFLPGSGPPSPLL